jgi:hypothetical protein
VLERVAQRAKTRSQRLPQLLFAKRGAGSQLLVARPEVVVVQFAQDFKRNHDHAMRKWKFENRNSNLCKLLSPDF